MASLYFPSRENRQYINFFHNPYDGYADGRTMGQIEPAYTAINFLVAWIWKNDS